MPPLRTGVGIGVSVGSCITLISEVGKGDSGVEVTESGVILKSLPSKGFSVRKAYPRKDKTKNRIKKTVTTKFFRRCLFSTYRYTLYEFIPWAEEYNLFEHSQDSKCGEAD